MAHTLHLSFVCFSNLEDRGTPSAISFGALSRCQISGKYLQGLVVSQN